MKEEIFQESKILAKSAMLPFVKSMNCDVPEITFLALAMVVETILKFAQYENNDFEIKLVKFMQVVRDCHETLNH